MASLQSSLEEKLKCSICSQTFKDPLVLGCSHSFCKACLDKRKVKECLICRKTSKHAPLHNLSLKDVCESFIEEKRRRISAETPGVICLAHAEKQQLFCVEDQKLVCLQCVSLDHQNHKFLSIKKVAGEHKTKLQRSVQTLETNLKSLSSKKLDYTRTSTEQLQSQVQQTEKKIKEEFEKLHQFLREEEEVRITALKKEEKEKKQKINKKIKEIDDICSGLSERIKQLQDDINGDDSLFLHNLREIEERANYTVTNPQLDLTPIDVTKHLGNLKYKVWEKMKDICPYYPVILDPRTKMSPLQVSGDLTGVTFAPGMTEKGIPLILGSEAFSSGTHSWEVELGNTEQWAVGVVNTSNKGVTSPCQLLIYHLKGKSSWNPAAPKFNKVCVTLEIEKGQVTFTNPDNNTILQSYSKNKFTEKMHPCFVHLAKSQ